MLLSQNKGDEIQYEGCADKSQRVNPHVEYSRSATRENLYRLVDKGNAVTQNSGIGREPDEITGIERNVKRYFKTQNAVLDEMGNFSKII